MFLYGECTYTKEKDCSFDMSRVIKVREEKIFFNLEVHDARSTLKIRI